MVRRNTVLGLTLSSPSPRLNKPDKASSDILNHKPLHAALFGHPVHPLPPSFTFRLSDALRKFSTYLGFTDFYAFPFFAFPLFDFLTSRLFGTFRCFGTFRTFRVKLLSKSTFRLLDFSCFFVRTPLAAADNVLQTQFTLNPKP